MTMGCLLQMARMARGLKKIKHVFRRGDDEAGAEELENSAEGGPLCASL